jgi:hypothetical protein
VPNTTENTYLSLWNPDESEIERNLNPSEDFQYGFKQTEVQVHELVKKDMQTLAEINITCEQAARAIDRLFQVKGDEYNNKPLLKWSFIHSPVCPWLDFCTRSVFDYIEDVTEIWVCNPDHIDKLIAFFDRLGHDKHPTSSLKELVDNDWVIIFSDLHPHLIRAHNFFEGQKTPYRVDPKRLVRYLVL